MTIAYHEINPESLDGTLKHGLKCSSRGDKGDDQDIIKTDAFLDKYRPSGPEEANVSRDNNLYAYLVVNTKISDITDGKLIEITDFIANSDQVVLRLKIDPTRCFVSDLDKYDAIKKRIVKSEDLDELRPLAEQYWTQLQPLNQYKTSSIHRPELMITYDISPEDITQASLTK